MAQWVVAAPGIDSTTTPLKPTITVSSSSGTGAWVAADVSGLSTPTDTEPYTSVIVGGVDAGGGVCGALVYDLIADKLYAGKSSDGNSWSLVEVANNAYPNVLRYGGGTWMMGVQNVDYAMAVSSDLVTWVPVDSPFSAVYAIGYHDGTWVAFGEAAVDVVGEPYAAFSTNAGGAWTAADVEHPGSGGGGTEWISIRDVCFANGEWTAVGLVNEATGNNPHVVAVNTTESDTTTLYTQDSPWDLTDGCIVAMDFSGITETYVALGAVQGAAGVPRSLLPWHEYVDPASGHYSVMTAPFGGIDWTERENPADSDGLNVLWTSVCAGGSPIVAVGEYAGGIYTMYSSDGVVWVAGAEGGDWTSWGSDCTNPVVTLLGDTWHIYANSTAVASAYYTVPPDLHWTSTDGATWNGPTTISFSIEGDYVTTEGFNNSVTQRCIGNDGTTIVWAGLVKSTVGTQWVDYHLCYASTDGSSFVAGTPLGASNWQNLTVGGAGGAPPDGSSDPVWYPYAVVYSSTTSTWYVCGSAYQLGYYYAFVCVIVSYDHSNLITGFGANSAFYDMLSDGASNIWVVGAGTFQAIGAHSTDGGSTWPYPITFQSTMGGQTGEANAGYAIVVDSDLEYAVVGGAIGTDGYVTTSALATPSFAWWSSSDGTSWSLSNTVAIGSTDTDGLTGIAYSGSEYIVVAVSGNNVIAYYSTDGASWSGPVTVVSDLAFGYLTRVAYGGGLFLVTWPFGTLNATIDDETIDWNVGIATATTATGTWTAPNNIAGLTKHFTTEIAFGWAVYGSFGGWTVGSIRMTG